MKLGVLFSGGKDSTYAAYLEKEKGNDLCCLITIISENRDSFMFHTPAVNLCEKQAKLMGIPIVVCNTKGQKEKELVDLEKAIKKAVEKYEIEGIVTGAVQSVYQSSRIKKICDKLKINCINPLWQKDGKDLLEEMIKNKFEIIITGIAAYPLDKKWIGRKIDLDFIRDMKKLNEKYKVSLNGEGGEFESLAVNCPLFSNKLDFQIKRIIGEGNSWRAEIE